jgi:hypothetical protein
VTAQSSDAEHGLVDRRIDRQRVSACGEECAKEKKLFVFEQSVGWARL